MNEKRQFRKVISALLCAVMLLCITPLTAAAADNVIDLTALGTQAVSTAYWDFDGEETITIKSDVTVAGYLYDVIGCLAFNVKNNSTVTWIGGISGESGSVDVPFVHFWGEGVLKIENGGTIIANNSGVVLKADSGVAVIVSSEGHVAANGVNVRCTAIEAEGSVLVSGGRVDAKSYAGSTAINAGGNVTVIDGVVSINENNLCGAAIRSDRDVEIHVDGTSYIFARAPVLAKKATVTVGGNAFIEATYLLEYAEDELYGNAITAKNVTVLDNAKVMAQNGAAILYSGVLEIKGGALLAYGDGIGGAGFKVAAGEQDDPENGRFSLVEHMLNVVFKIESLDIREGVVYSDRSNIEDCHSGDAVILAWEYMEFYEYVIAQRNNPSYRSGDQTDIIAYPDGGFNYEWYVRGRVYDINYNNNEVDGWFSIDINPMNKMPLNYNPKKDPSTDPRDPSDPDDGNGKNGNNGRKNTPSGPSGSFSGGSSFSKGTGAGIVYTVQKDFSQFDSVKVDSSTLTGNKDYIAESGSTKITLLPIYLDALTVGSHTLTVSFKDNTTATASFSVAAGKVLPFTDVAANAWYYSAVHYSYTNELILGTATDKFSPNSALTRGMIVTILYRNAGEPSISGFANPFSDVQNNIWYTDAVKWAANNSIVVGYGNGKFGPDDPVTKEQLAALIYRTQQSSGKTPPSTGTGKSFTDADKISNWAKDAVNALNRQGIFGDMPGSSMNPQNSATRAEVSSMLYRYLAAV